MYERAKLRQNPCQKKRALNQKGLLFGGKANPRKLLFKGDIEGSINTASQNPTKSSQEQRNSHNISQMDGLEQYRIQNTNIAGKVLKTYNTLPGTETKRGPLCEHKILKQTVAKPLKTGS